VHLIQQIKAAELDENSIVRREEPLSDQTLNNVAGVDEIYSIFAN
jgi:hypothetical protein